MSTHSQVVEQRPRSDVSSGVGLAGLLGLFAWIAVCRNWPAIADAFAIGGPREPLAGPYAALAALFFSGSMMVGWSLLVDKVHLRASTGIDWSKPRTGENTLDISITKLAGLWATWAVIGFLYCVARWYWEGQYLFAMEVIGTAAIPMFLLSVPYVLWLDRYLVNPRDGAWHFGAMLIGREACDFDEVKAHFRSWAVKGFFCAFMISILPGGFEHIVTLDIAAIRTNPVDVSWGLIELLFLIDVQIAMVGYLLTMKPLDAHIRSANPFIAGWVAAVLVSYAMVLWAGLPLWTLAAGAALSFASQMGDAAESALKRKMKVKDSSSLIPGHGGVMDRVDGLVFACFLAFLGTLALSAASGRLESAPGEFISGK